jgi:poly-gamma-glutamate capsule biosynthesis protein CapA/YwtB (metallophosphatase superfamily)
MLARGGVPLVPEWQRIDLSVPPNLEFGSKQSYYMAALESPITAEIETLTAVVGDEMNLCSESSETSILQKAGFNLLTFSNNHQNDCQQGGATETENFLSASGMQPFRLEDGMWVASLPDSNVIVIAVDDVAVPLDVNQVTTKIEDNKVRGKFVVLSIHWGLEYQAGPSNRQLELAQAWTDAGADIIWGHHPHVLQRMELLTSRVDGHQTLVMYSLGNLLADQFMLEDAQRSALIQVIVKKGQIQRIIIIPAKFDWERLILDFSPEPDERTRILERINLQEFDPVFAAEYMGKN